jgi:hypothetical protein
MDLSGFLGSLSDTFSSALSWIKNSLLGLGNWALDHLKSVWGVLKGGVLSVLKALKTLSHLNWRELWQLIKKGYDHLRQWIAWWQKHILKPLSDMRASIMRLYNTFFRPVIAILESLRTMVRFLSIFDRKLAALLDSKLSALESLVMTPITAMLKRLNGLSSYLRAILTPLGMLDRVLLLESMRRDASLIWQVLTNPLAAIHAATAPATPRTQTDRVNDFADFVAGRGGTYADSTDKLTLSFKNLLGGVE